MTTLDAQRAVTAAFIADDPTEVTLVPWTETVTDGGGRMRVAGTPRDPQTFKVIPMTYDQRPAQTGVGVERTIDYHLLGTVDAVVEVGDIFELDGVAGFWEVVAISDGHRYETKMICSRHIPRDGAS